MRILVVEDDPKSARLIKDILELRRYVVIEASNGLSAMRIINDHIPDLIFMDMNLPGMDGITLTRLIKTSSKTANIPVIALTAAAMKGDRDRFVQAGCDDYISKPFHVKDVLDVIKKYAKAEEQRTAIHPPIILIADDRPENIELISATLSPMGYNIIKAANGMQAMEKIRTLRPDIAMINVFMPELNGIEVCKNIKSDERYSSIPVIMITALDDADSKMKALSVGADEFLTKPIDRYELIVRVGNLLNVKKHIDTLNNQIVEKTKELQKAIAELKDTNINVIYRLSRAVEYIDNDTGDHNIRVSKYVMSIAGSMGFTKEEVETISIASSLHDIGKIGVPSSILLKPSSLTPEEFEQVKKHTSIGANILNSSGSKLLDMAGQIALTHHERMDGTGYPQGLRSDSIPIAGRITAVADVFDSMTIKRPYRDAIPVDQTVEYIKSHAGTQFDPQITDVFLRHLKDILDIKYMLKE
jgi:putative two-component system response regulator